MQQISVFQTIANGGVREPIKLVKGIGDGSGGFTAPADDRVAVQVVPASVATQMTRMMQAVPTKNGTAPKAVVEGYNVAGKTGTARKSQGGGYARRYVAYFAGLVPVEKPRFSMVVVINDPDPSRGGSTYGGGYVSAPVFARVMEGALRLMDVPPDDIESWIAAQAKGELGPRVAAAPIAPGAALDADRDVARPATPSSALPTPLPEPLEAVR